MVFSSLVIPAVIAFLFTSHFRTALFLAWASGSVAVIGGIVASFYWDVATGPLLVSAFGAVLIVAFMIRPLVGARPGTKVYVALLDEGEGVGRRRCRGAPAGEGDRDIPVLPCMLSEIGSYMPSLKRCADYAVGSSVAALTFCMADSDMPVARSGIGPLRVQV